MLKCNAEFVDAVFSLMFDTFWVPPYDRRRSHPVLIDFERNARQTSLLLSTADTATASAAQVRRMQEAVASLARCVERLAEARLFAAGTCVRALGELNRIRVAFHADNTAETVPQNSK